MKINRLTHFEKLLVTVGSLYMASLYFIFKTQSYQLTLLITNSVILICFSMAYYHLLLIATSYVIDIIKMERELQINHLAERWRLFNRTIIYSYFIISFWPFIFTVISILLLGYNCYCYEKNLDNLIAALFIILLFSIFFCSYAIKPYQISYKELNKGVNVNEIK